MKENLKFRFMDSIRAEIDIVLIKCGWMQPGLTGGSQDTYVRHMLVRARSKGWRVVVFNSRGCGNSPVTTPQVSSIESLIVCAIHSCKLIKINQIQRGLNTITFIHDNISNTSW